MKRRTQPACEFTVLTLVLGALLGVFLGFWSCSRQDDPGKVESITIRGPISDAAALIITAEDKHFLRRME